MRDKCTSASWIARERNWEATGDSKERDLAEQIANSVTWLLMSDGKMRIGFWMDFESSIPMVLVWNSQFTRLMSCLPETAPRNENHLLQHTSFVRKIDYQPKQIDYETIGKSYDILKVASAPKRVRAGDKLLEQTGDASLQNTGWSYDAKTGLLKLSHTEPQVRITL